MSSEEKPKFPQPKGDFGKFTDFMRKLVAVPHSEIKTQLDAEKLAKKRKVSSRVSHAKG